MLFPFMHQRDSRKYMPQGLKAKKLARLMSGLKPGPTQAGSLSAAAEGNVFRPSGTVLPANLHDLRRRPRREGSGWRDSLAPVEFPAHHVQPIDASFEGTGEAAKEWRLLCVFKEVELGNDVVALFARLDHFEKVVVL